MLPSFCQHQKLVKFSQSVNFVRRGREVILAFMDHSCCQTFGSMFLLYWIAKRSVAESAQDRVSVHRNTTSRAVSRRRGRIMIYHYYPLPAPEYPHPGLEY